MQPLNFETAHGNVTLREAKRSDMTQFRELRLNALQDSPTAFSADYQTNLNQPLSYWDDRLNFNEHEMIFFAEHDSQLIGMTGVVIGKSPKTKHGAIIWGVYICPEWRGLKIAEGLIKACIEWAKWKEVAIVKLGVMTNNISAVRCYERCGFTTYGTEPRGILYEGKYYDEYLMSRTLDNS